VAATCSLHLGGVPHFGYSVAGFHLHDVNHSVFKPGARRSLKQIQTAGGWPQGKRQDAKTKIYF